MSLIALGGGMVAPSLSQKKRPALKEEQRNARLTAMGAVSEALMALYGISRMLQSRELSGARVMPAIVAFADEVGDLRPQLDMVFEVLSEATDSTLHLKQAVTALREPATEVVEALNEAFSVEVTRQKLNAKHRLSLEMKTVQLGGQLEAIRSLIDLLHAAIDALPVDLAIADVATGRWCNEPTFASRRIELALDLPNSGRFQGDPWVIWGLLEGSLRWLLERGVGGVFLRSFTAEDDSNMRLQLRPWSAQDKPTTIEYPIQQLRLGIHLPIECVVIRAVAKHRRIGLKLDTSRNQVNLFV